ncbi:HD-GYP domain-containing protein [Virgibacillus kekensis]|uniref:HD-GYP domain-containing protein n=1 Tax=Virgibacillus kekensis TaxID=202261 RepID=A0ABV9DKT0_9BACI
MRLVSTKSLKPGVMLGQTIYNERGQVLLQKGLNLTERLIRRLTERGITYVYIEDELTNDIHIESPISDTLRIEATEVIKGTFTDMRNSGIMDNSYILDKRGEKLTNVVQRIVDEMRNNSGTLSLLADIFVTDNYIFQHSLNVTIYTLAIGLEMGMTTKQLSEIGTGAMLHDIGKVFIDQDILQKPGNLTEEEYETVKNHTKLGYDFLRKQLEVPLLVAHCAYQHHERLDGTGYPRGIKEEELHPYAKLLGIADVFDAVTSNRVYRDAMLPHEGLEILYAGSAKLFDINIIEAFKKSVAVYPNGLTVQLSDNRTGIVSRQNKFLCDRPVIKIHREDDKEVTKPYEIDLGRALNLTITSISA